MTEPIWDGKYDDKGRKVAPPRIALPFQTVARLAKPADPGRQEIVLPPLLQESTGKVQPCANQFRDKII